MKYIHVHKKIMISVYDISNRLECTDSDPSMWPLLPDHHHLLSEGNWTETASFFMVSSQWAPSATPVYNTNCIT